MFGLPLLVALCAPAAEADDVAAKTVEKLNAYRTGAGLKPVVLDPKLTAGCVAHAQYLAKNVNPRKGAANPHEENKDLPGYSEEGEKTSMRAAVNFSFGVALGPEVVDELMGCFFHRIALIRPDLARVGSARVIFGAEKDCWNVLDAKGGREPGEASKETVAYPGDKQQNVPLLFAKNEAPNPIPPEGRKNRAGFPITVTFPEDAKIEAAELVLQDGAGKEVPGWFSSPEKPAFRPEYQYNTVTLIPKQPLRPKTTYTATLKAKVDGKEYSKKWTFTTANK
jgi:hypothetical protein